ncbi:MAG: UBP-type zinc finger domain-containing protein [SAR202 cluster bacterium]|nr:UBP-type zinc finger domain-containing protein [SAR202 cluster bacterium]
MLKTECEHYRPEMAAKVGQRSQVCEVCAIEGPLRVCADCGFVGCCESRNSQDTEHWKLTGHAVIVQLPLRETSFTWCYAPNDYLK